MKQTNTTPTLKMDKLRACAASRSPPAAVFFVFREPSQAPPAEAGPRRKEQNTMMIEEFEQRTGYFPSSAEYKAIEAAYMEFDGDKDEFCKAYKKNANGIAERIRREVNAAAFKESRQHTADLTRRDIEIERLKKQLEREQEWKPYEDADAVSQADYDELATSGGTDKMTDDEAKALLYNWYGFAKEMVVILRTAPIYEINRHRQLREVGAVDRAPLYNSTDWNYIRFTCGRMSYELYNDTLRPCAS